MVLAMTLVTTEVAGALPDARGDIRFRPARLALMGLGWTMVAFGISGAFLPLVPTTVFFLIAMWAFSTSSPRFQSWLLNHPRWGKTLRAWCQHRAIPRKAKIAAVSSMSLSVGILVFATGSWMVPLIVAFILAPIAAFIVSRSSSAPA